MKKHTTKALITSLLSMLLCVSMLIGSTFAWFTDTATTGVNTIMSGNLDVALEMFKDGKWVNAEGETLDFVKAAGAAANEGILWEPDCTYVLPEIRVINNGNLWLKYQIRISGIDGDAKVNEVIEWTYNETEAAEAQAVTNLTVKNTTFASNKKAAILVGTKYGANITLENVDITKVAADSTNAVWVEDVYAAYADTVVVTGGAKIIEQ